MSETNVPVWSWLLRLFHWLMVISIVFLIITGFYINDPWIAKFVFPSSRCEFPMGSMRFIHFLSGYVFTAALMMRLYLLFFGNKYERFTDFLPISRKNINNLFKTLAFYTYFTDKSEKRYGHNVLAGTFYFVTFIVGILQIISGFFMLFPEIIKWQKIGITLFNSQQNGRLIHHFFMWYFIVFTFIHLYIVIWNEVKSPEGMILSIFTGKKNS